MQEAAERTRFCEKEFDEETMTVSFSFGNGTTLELDLTKLSAEMQKRLMLHGALQKIGDSYAGAKGNFAEGIAAAKSVIDQLLNGVWKAARGEGEGKPRLSELAEAIARIKGVPVERAYAAVEKASDEQRKQWRSNAKVKAEIARIRAEKAAKELEEAQGGAELAIEV